MNINTTFKELSAEVIDAFLESYGGYTSCHNHTEISNFRMKDCIIRVEQLIDYSIMMGYKGVAMTDHEAISGHIDFMNRFDFLVKTKAKYDNHVLVNEKDKDIMNNIELMKNWVDDFKPILGNEIYLIDDIEDVTTNYESGVTKFFHFILMAKNKKGYKQIREISSGAWDNWYRQGRIERVPTIKRELEAVIGGNKGNIIATSACLGSEFAQLALKYYKYDDQVAGKKLAGLMKWAIRVFGKENFFLELQPTLSLPNLENPEETHDQIIYNQNILKVAKAYGVGYTIATDSHYLKKEHRSIHEDYLTADDGNSNNRELKDFYETTYLMPVPELVQLMSTHLPLGVIETAFENTMKIHDMIEIYSMHMDTIVPRDKHIPKFEVYHDMREHYDTIAPYIKKFAFSKDEQERYFLYKCEQGMRDKGIEITEEIVKRINIEMEEIWETSEKINMRVAPYYILVEVLVNKIMWEVSYVGVARGSVTGFYTAYVMDITQMNPLEYELPHWRHLSKERPELPDIDLDTEASKRHMIFDSMKEYYGFDNVLNILTLKTEGSKSTTLTACRGWRGVNEKEEEERISADVAQSIADMIPFERGASWSLTDCFEGNRKKDRKRITQLINVVAEYDGLKETMLLIEGLVCGRSIHASGVYIFENGYLAQNGRMRAPNGDYITTYTMKISDLLGGLKVDCLTIKALDKIHKAMDLLMEYGKIQWQGTIKATYNKYIHPDVLELEAPEMWKMIAENTLIDAFQFDTDVGSNAGIKVKPTSIPEMAVANSLMRLMGEHGAEQPIDTYIRYKADISLWYKEMRDWGLNEDEIAILEKHLLPLYGVADTQEVVMEMTMDIGIASFDVVKANKMRKAIAKKDEELLNSVRQLFYSHATESGTRNELVTYVWEVQIKRQLGYSFSKNHTNPYSAICVQELNLAHRFDKIFWNTACLTVNAGADENNANNKNTEYGKIASAIGQIQRRGQQVALPHINKVKFGFIPDLDTHEIVFGLKGISGIGDDLAKDIIAHQPYTGIEDLQKRVEISDSAIIILIKSGAFDILYGTDRLKVMEEFVKTLVTPLSTLTTKHIPLLKELNILSDKQVNYELRLFNFKQYIFSNKKLIVKRTGKGEGTFFFKLPNKVSEEFFLDYFASEMKEGEDVEKFEEHYFYTPDGGLAVKKGAVENVFKKLIKDFTNTTLGKNNIETVNSHRHKLKWNERVKCSDIAKWEMDSLSFYHGNHELANIDKSEYSLSIYDKLPEVPVITEYNEYRGRKIPRFELTRICGTVLDKDKNKSTITLLTLSGVVKVKFYKGQFGFYDKQISHRFEGEDKSKVLEKSWFKRGSKLLITGYRRDKQFVPKKYSDSAYRHTVQLIKEINEDGTLVTQIERIDTDEL